MAMQTGVGFTKILILVGAGYTSTVLLKNGKLSDLIGELQSLVKGLENSENSTNADPQSDAIAAQVRRLAMEVRQLASARQITVLNGNSSQIGNMTSLVVPAAALGALGYGYMWWKGFSFSDLMYVTKRNMANAVSNLTKHLENVTEALAAAKRHLTQRIENLDGKLDEQVEISRLIKNQMTDVHADVSQVRDGMDELRYMFSGLDERIYSMECKQDLTNCGVLYLCNMIDGKKMTLPSHLQEKLKISGKPRGYLTSSETPSLKGLKEIAESLVSGKPVRGITDGVVQDGVGKIDEPGRTLMRTASSKC